MIRVHAGAFISHDLCDISLNYMSSLCRNLMRVNWS
jgi:hypothetical protein